VNKNKEERNANCTSRPDTVSRQKTEEYISSTIYQEEEHLEVEVARSQDDTVCKIRIDKHPGQIVVMVLPRPHRMINYN